MHLTCAYPLTSLPVQRITGGASESADDGCDVKEPRIFSLRVLNVNYVFRSQFDEKNLGDMFP